MGGRVGQRKSGTKQGDPPKLARSDQLTQPIHNQVADLIRQRIVSGEYTEDEGLPPEWTLTEIFNVSRHTIRAALQKLASDGLIERRRGMRTTIRPFDPSGDAWVVDSLDAIIGEFHSAELISAKVVPARDYPEMMKLFGLGKQAELFKVIRLLHSDTGPYAHSTIFTRSEYGKRIPLNLIGDRIFVKLVEEYCKVRASRVRQSSAAAIGSPDAAVALGVPIDYPMLRLRRLFQTFSGDPVTHVEMFCRSDRYTPVVVFARDEEPS